MAYGGIDAKQQCSFHHSANKSSAGAIFPAIIRRLHPGLLPEMKSAPVAVTHPDLLYNFHSVSAAFLRERARIRRTGTLAWLCPG